MEISKEVVRFEEHYDMETGPKKKCSRCKKSIDTYWEDYNNNGWVLMFNYHRVKGGRRGEYVCANSNEPI